MARRSGESLPPPVSLARRHFMGIAAAGTARLSSIVIPSVLLASKSADALGILPRGDPNRGRDHHCFGRGTLIQTVHGEVPIEHLTIGELVITANGAIPIKWIGRRTIRRNASARWHPSVMPIRVARFALDDQTPRKDLYLSEGHSLLIDGFLIPVKHLVNERSIAIDRGVEKSETIEYFSIELDTHQVIFAEGAAAETFRYAGDQIAWDNRDEYEDLYGREHKVMPPFAPHCRYKGGRAEVSALLRLAASRFGDMRDPIQIAYTRIAARALLPMAA
ncbi:Hint domain-containing protein [Bradyrhizobium sp. MOS001]|uniref:Hint domain-containing protein n=1 Tax=unclassified Bradyrhizobium TaxID=2631580 RepID=UPI0010758476|nr:Hint domain-containing protein [Bradyrhizobium sp. MOS001]TFW54454.1 Hint domain-containing protein [Bradyrhizobium sp. MOS001]